MNPVRSLLNMRGTLLGYSLEPRSERRVRGTAGSVMTVRLSVNRCSHTKSQYDEFKQDSEVQKTWAAVSSKVYRHSGRASFSSP